MTTLLTSLFYLWLVTSILLVALWFLRRQDRSRGDEPDPDTMLPGFDGPVLQASPPDMTTEAETEETVDTGASSEDAQTAEDTQLAEDASEDDADGGAETGSEASGKAAEEKQSEPGPSESSKPGTKASKSKRSQKKKSGQDKSGPDKSGSGKSSPDKSRSKKTESVSGNSTEVEPDPASEDEPEAPNDLPVRAKKPPTLDDLLDGIKLPFNLTPLTLRIDDPDRHAMFLSSHDDAGEVGTAFADQLVGLGYEIEPSGFDEAIANRNGDVLSMRIAADAGTNEEGEEPRYPTAAKSDVVIEVWTGTGPPPQLAN